jgi:hypothetical protein
VLPITPSHRVVQSTCASNINMVVAYSSYADMVVAYSRWGIAPVGEAAAPAGGARPGWPAWDGGLSRTKPFGADVASEMLRH